MQTQDKDNKIIEKEPRKEDLVKQLPKVPTWPTGLRFSKGERMEISVAKDLAVVLTHHAFEQLFGWAYSTNREISCLGSIRRDGNIFIVEQMHLLKQTCSSVSTEIDETAIASLLEKLIAEGKSQEAHSIKCWAHSHPGMGVFWSGTDRDTCRLLASDYLVSIVVSDSFAIQCRIDVAAPVPMAIDRVPVLYEMPQDKELAEKFAQEVKEAVSERFFFFDEPDDKKDKKPDKKPEDRKPNEDYEYVPALYCGYCGGFHGEGECLLDVEGSFAEALEEDEFFI